VPVVPPCNIHFSHFLSTQYKTGHIRLANTRHPQCYALCNPDARKIAAEYVHRELEGFRSAWQSSRILGRLRRSNGALREGKNSKT